MAKPENYPQEPKFVWDQFFKLTQIPRPSKKEEKVRKYLLDMAKEHGLVSKTDKIGNVCILVPATPGYENKDAVILQNHMDMVCDATPDRKIDFENDPIVTYVEDGFLKADRTTLGADNGIGCALALACILDKSLKHPPLELLFTVDEETGLTGTLHLDTKILKGKKLINLDTEDYGSFYIGCAGGFTVEMTAKSSKTKPRPGLVPVSIMIGDLDGGHSGAEIHHQRGNAIKILADFLFEARELNYQLVSIEAGKAHNIIPRDASAVIFINSSKIRNLNKLAEKLIKRLKSHLPKEDHKLTIEVAKLKEKPKFVLPQSVATRILNLLVAFPHGAKTYNYEVKNGPLVNLSNNLAIVRINPTEIFVLTSVRFMDSEESHSHRNTLVALGEANGMTVTVKDGYPSWKPVLDSELLRVLSKEYRRLHGEDPKVKAIHAGLECGIIRDKFGGKLDVISIGPNAYGPHSPSEKLEIISVGKIWNLLTAALEKL